MSARDSDDGVESSACAMERAIDRFERSWQAGDRPSIRDYCPADGPTRAPLLVELAHVDFEYRYRAGERPLVEEYLRQYPELKDDDRAVIDLAAAECRWQIHVGQTAEPKGPAPKPVDGPHRRAQPAPDGSKKPFSSEEAQSGIEVSQAGESREKSTGSLSTKSIQANPADEGSTSHTVSTERAGREIVLAGRFRLLDCLGEGSFGSVYRAVDLRLDRVVAVKIPRGGVFGTKEERQRLLREARNAAQLRHPNIVPVYEVPHEDGRPFIVSALVAGETLAKLMKTRAFGPRAAAEITAALADALHFAHEHQVVHRDVKPSNIILESHNFPVLMDFGLAKREGVDVSLTHEGQMVGTPAYMSPEQAGGEVSRVDAHSDVYSLGVVLYELLTGERPFRGNVRMIIHQVINEEPRSPITLNDSVPRDLATICLKCLQKAPTSRYQTAHKLGEDLRRFLRREPIHARPVSFLEREWRRIRRRPWTSALITTVIALTITVAAVSAIAAFRIDVARRRSEVSARESLDRLEQLYLVNGNASVEKGNPFGACPWFVRAWHMRPRDASRDTVFRSRLATTMRQMPRLIHFWSHAGSANYAQFSPDGQLIAVASSDRVVMLYDLTMPAKAAIVLKHQAAVLQCEFDSTGERLATTSYDRRVRVWHTRGGDHEPMILNHPQRATWAAFSPDSQRIATACRDGVVRFWNAATGRVLPEILHHKGSVTHLAFSSDGRRIATASEDGTARVWLVETGEPTGSPLVHDGPVDRLCLSPDGRRVFTASADATARIWDATTSQQQFVLQHAGQVLRIIHAPQQDWVITATVDGAVRVWDATTGTVVRDLTGHVDRVLDMSLSADGRRLATASEDNTARVWNLEIGALEYPSIVHSNGVAAAAFSNDGRHLVTAAYDATVRLWRLDESFEWEVRADVTERVRHVAFSPEQRKLLITTTSGVTRLCSVDKENHTVQSLPGDAPVRASALADEGDLLATASDDGRVRVWDLKVVRPIDSSDPFEEQIDGLHFSPDEERLLIACADGTACVWNVSSELPMVVLEHGSSLLRAGFGSVENTVYTVGDDLIVKIWDTRSGELRSQVRTDSNRSKSYFFSPGSELFVKAGRYGDAQVWDVSTQGIHSTLDDSGLVVHATFSPDESRLVTGSVDDLARLWDVTTGKALTGPLAHRRDVTFCAFSVRGELVATASDDQTARIWDVQSGDPVSPYLPHSDRVVFVAFQSDEDRLISVSADASVRAWDLGNRGVPTKQLIRLARIASGHEIDDSGSMMPISKAVLEEDWADYQRGLELTGGSQE